MPAPLTHIEIEPGLAAVRRCVVIGGGIVGAFTACYIAKPGRSRANREKALFSHMFNKARK